MTNPGGNTPPNLFVIDHFKFAAGLEVRELRSEREMSNVPLQRLCPGTGQEGMCGKRLLPPYRRRVFPPAQDFGGRLRILREGFSEPLWFNYRAPFGTGFASSSLSRRPIGKF